MNKTHKLALSALLGLHASQYIPSKVPQVYQSTTDFVRTEAWVGYNFSDPHRFGNQDRQRQYFLCLACGVGKSLLLFEPLLQIDQGQFEPHLADVIIAFNSSGYESGNYTNKTSQKGENSSDDNRLVDNGDQVFHKMMLGGCIGLVISIPTSVFLTKWLLKKFF